MSQHVLHVSSIHSGATDSGVGTEDRPYRTIQAALDAAKPGDIVMVHPGLYRETLRPRVEGASGAPIRIVSAVPLGAVVRGSEVLRSTPLEPGCHELDLPSALVGDRNPFAERLKGSRIGGTCGQVFVNGAMLREVGTREAWERSSGTWVALDGGMRLGIHLDRYASRGEIEISVRDRLFAPERRGMGYIEVEGFLFEHCANQSAAAFWEENGTQRGAVGLRAGHHMRVAGCHIRNAKTIGLDLGVEGGLDGGLDGVEPHDNVIEDNTISGCGEVGACGRLSRRTIVRRNRILGNACLSLHTVEEAGLKFHQFYDGLIEQNVIANNDAAGIWLDAVWPGARVTRNLVVNNVGSGIFMELGAEGATVDHNIVGMTRLGDGIYAHDASDMLVAHNLVFGNAHFGIYLRYVTDRPFERTQGERKPAECSRNRVLNNFLIDNYRGHICLPANAERSQGNVSDYNHFVNGTQWQWEGASFHRFCLGDNDGSIPRDQVHAQLTAAGVALGPDPMNAVLDLAEWRKLGYDHHSSAPQAFRITTENGAVVKGTFTMGANDPFLQFRFSEEGLPPAVPALEGLTHDYHGQPRGRETIAGPLSTVEAGYLSIDVSPR